MSEDLDILIPHYRDPEGLAASLKSIAEQTWQGEMRVVVIDDGSPDGDYAQVEKICSDFRHFYAAPLVLDRNPQNLGRPKTRNRLLGHAYARYVAWLDAGDIWYPDKLAIQFEHLLRLRFAGKDVNVIWVSCHYDWHQSGQAKPRMIQQETAGDQIQSLLVGTKLRAYLWTLLGTAEAFRIAGRFDENLPRLQDLDYFLNFVRAGGQIEVPPSRSAQCCYFKSDIGRNAREIHACYDLILRKHRPVILRYPAAVRSELGYKVKRLSERFARSNGEYLRAASYFGQAVVTSPRHSIRVLNNVLRGKRKGAGH